VAGDAGPFFVVLGFGVAHPLELGGGLIEEKKKKKKKKKEYTHRKRKVCPR